MAKQGMARPEWTHTQPRNSAPPVPEIQGKAKHGKAKARPIIPGTSGPEMKVFHERPIPSNLYPEIEPIWPGTIWKTTSRPPTWRTTRTLVSPIKRKQGNENGHGPSHGLRHGAGPKRSGDETI